MLIVKVIKNCIITFWKNCKRKNMVICLLLKHFAKVYKTDKNHLRSCPYINRHMYLYKYCGFSNVMLKMQIFN